MHYDQKQVSLFERLAVMAIFLIVAAFAIQNVWHEVKTSEERILNNAAGEFEELMKMYPEKFQTLPQSMVRMSQSGLSPQLRIRISVSDYRFIPRSDSFLTNEQIRTAPN